MRPRADSLVDSLARIQAEDTLPNKRRIISEGDAPQVQIQEREARRAYREDLKRQLESIDETIADILGAIQKSPGREGIQPGPRQSKSREVTPDPAPPEPKPIQSPGRHMM